MKLYLSGHNYQYALEQSLLTLFPDQRPEYPDGPPAPGEDAVWSTLTVTGDTASAEARLQWKGQTAQSVSSCPAAELTGGLVTDRLLQRLIKQSFYRAAIQLREGPPPPWGMLTGIRPAKLASRALESGMTVEETRRQFLEVY